MCGAISRSTLYCCCLFQFCALKSSKVHFPLYKPQDCVLYTPEDLYSPRIYYAGVYNVFIRKIEYLYAATAWKTFQRIKSGSRARVSIYPREREREPLLPIVCIKRIYILYTRSRVNGNGFRSRDATNFKGPSALSQRSLSI